jgi:hypothetical protein
VLRTVINAFPANVISLPTPLTIQKEPAFFKAITNAYNAEEQKPCPVKATWMYALSLRNLINLWKHSMQHLKQLEMQLRQPLLLPAILLTYLSTNSKMILMLQITASKNVPKASEPALYLKPHHNPSFKLKVPLVS